MLRTGKYAEAYEMFGQLAKQKPLAAALGQAETQRQRGKLDKARAILVAAAAAQPKEPGPVAALARLDYESGQLDQAREQVEAALKLDPDHPPARWFKALLLRDTGKLDEAEEAFKWFIFYYNGVDVVEDPEWLRYVGLAAAEYARWKRDTGQFDFLVNDLRDEQLAVDEEYWPAHLEAGRLYLEKFNQAQATQELKQAIAINPSAAEVHVALGELAAQKYQFDDAKRLAEAALELNPKLVSAHRLLADAMMANFKVSEAAEKLKETSQLNPVSEETLGRLAACYLILDGRPDPADQDARVNQLVAEVIERNPRCGQFYLTLAQSLEERRRFSMSEAYFQASMDRMPQLIGSRAGLGMLYMRMGQEAEGNKLLTEAFEIDPFNVRVSNTLKVLEVLEDYETLETEHFTLKFAGKSDRILARYAAEYLEEEYPKLCKQLGYEVPQRSLFEFFSKARNTNGHGWFSARMIGLPYLGTVGACAGKIVALTSPNEQSYNWARVLKHEFVHVINLQQTDFNIPHWFTEGLAVMNEGYPRPKVWNELLVERVGSGKLFTLDDINFGFIRPESGLDWQMAYCQSELYVEYMLERYGDDAIARLLAAYEDSLDTATVLREAFGAEQADFEEGYVKYLKKVAAEIQQSAPAAEEMSFAELERAYEADKDNPDLAARLAQAQLARRNYPEAGKLAKQALKLKPKHGLASYVLARVHMVIGENQEALALLEAGLDEKRPDENLLALLAGLKLKSEDYDEAARLYGLGMKANPYDNRWAGGLARVYLLNGDDKKLAGVLEKLAEMDADNFTVRKKLAKLALDAKDFEGAVRWSREAIYVNVLDPEVHDWYGQALVALDLHAMAVREYEVASELNPDSAEYVYALAQAARDAKQPDKAKAAAEQVLKLDPNHEAAQQLLKELDP